MESAEAQRALEKHRIVEFDRVRAAAALEMPESQDPTLLPDLVACLPLPHAPIPAIEKAIEELGGSVPESQEVIIERGRAMDPEEAIRYFHAFQSAAASWPAERRAGFYYFFGRKMERALGWDEATAEEQRRLVSPLVERVYIDIESRRIGAITPAPAFRSLLEGAPEQSGRSTCVLLPAEVANRPDGWTWWRRGRIELPVQRKNVLNLLQA